jgi:hypothetical protein
MGKNHDPLHMIGLGEAGLQLDCTRGNGNLLLLDRWIGQGIANA